ncbi:MAG: hypothetical protein ACKV2O_16945 [Acidimicrobiales bacterium]
MRSVLTGAWPLRLIWLVLPLSTGSALAEALEGRSGAVAATAAVLAWAGWALGLVAALVAHPLSLTALRVLGPAVAAVSGASVVSGRPGWPVTVSCLVVSGAATALALSAGQADRCVDAASYGAERRFALRVPSALLAGPLPLAWVLLTGWLVGAPMLAAARQWWAAALVAVVGAPLAWAGVRALHGLSQRVVVLVPAGMVLLDRATLVDPVLFSRDVMTSIGPADPQRVSTATDLTLGGAGLVLELRLERPLRVPLRQGRKGGDAREVDSVLFTPVRPGRLLQAAAGHRLPVG